MVSLSPFKNISRLPAVNRLVHTSPQSVTASKDIAFNFVPSLSKDTLVLKGAAHNIVPNTVEKAVPALSDGLKLSDVLFKYNAKKLASAAKHGRTSEILKNWDDSFGIANKSGVFENAINKLKQPNGAIDTYLYTAFPKINDTTRAEAKKLLTEYLNNNLDIYSYPRLKGILSGFSKQIQKSGKDAVIYIPDPDKSYGIIGSLYKQIQPEAKFVTGWKNLQKHTASNPNTKIVVLDDCFVTGSSGIDLYKSITDGCKNVKSVDLYVCAAYEKGLAAAAKNAPGLNVHYSGNPKKTLEETDFFKNLVVMMGGKPKTVKQDFLKTLLRCQDTSQGYSAGTAVMFPYMAPNNNSLFSANMIQYLFSGPQFAIKNVEKSIVSKDGKLVYPPKWLTERLF